MNTEFLGESGLSYWGVIGKKKFTKEQNFFVKVGKVFNEKTGDRKPKTEGIRLPNLP
jgi:hypothetical protein